MTTLKALKRSPLGRDLYFWLVYRTFTLKAPLRLSWKQLYRQFGAEPANAGKHSTVKSFRVVCLRELKKIKRAWPDLNYPHGDGWARRVTVAAAHPAGTASTHQRIGQRALRLPRAGRSVARAVGGGPSGGWSALLGRVSGLGWGVFHKNL